VADPPIDPETLVQRAGGAGVEPSPRSFALTVASGPDKGRRFAIDPLHASRVLIGQSEACAVRLSDRAVSRRHAALEAKRAVIRIIDLDSTNGTFVDRVRVYEADLNGGEVLRVGSTTLRVDEVDPGSSGDTPKPLGGERRLPPATAFGRLLGSSP
jgi:two-component system, NtrC family, response regulator HydG